MLINISEGTHGGKLRDHRLREFHSIYSRSHVMETEGQ
jgi:hypothetical protein